jgi:hypothetical protein
MLDDSGERGERPEPRLIRHSRDAEVAAAEWLRYWGFPDARTTPANRIAAEMSASEFVDAAPAIAIEPKGEFVDGCSLG